MIFFVEIKDQEKVNNMKSDSLSSSLCEADSINGGMDS
jgi:hypothetical protein